MSPLEKSTEGEDLAKNRPRSPTADRRALALALRELREAAGLSLEVAAREALEASAAKLSRIETNRQSASPRDVRDLCALYGVDDERTAELLAWAASAREPAWWESYAINDDDYVGLESAATRIREFEASLVPALLQTRKYAETYVRALILPGRQEPWNRSELSQWLEIWERRRALLESDSGVVHSYVLDEAAVLRAVAGDAMREQIEHLIASMERSNVELRIIPFSRGASPGQLGGFTVLSLPHGPDVAYVESQSGFQLLDDPEDLERLIGLFGQLHSEGLDPDGTKSLLEGALKRWP